MNLQEYPSLSSPSMHFTFHYGITVVAKAKGKVLLVKQVFKIIKEEFDKWFVLQNGVDIKYFVNNRDDSQMPLVFLLP